MSLRSISRCAALRVSVLAAMMLASSPCLSAQAKANADQTTIPVAVRFVTTEANAPPGTCGCFWLTGAALDAAVPLTRHLAAQVEISGVTVGQVPASTRGLSEILLLAGPLYAIPIRRTTVSARALFGAVHGFDSNFVVGNHPQDTSTNLAIALGGALEVPVTHRLSVRALQIDYVQTNLPNGADNRQRNIRLGAGIVFRIHLPASR